MQCVIVKRVMNIGTAVGLLCLWAVAKADFGLGQFQHGQSGHHHHRYAASNSSSSNSSSSFESSDSKQYGAMGGGMMGSMGGGMMGAMGGGIITRNNAYFPPRINNAYTPYNNDQIPECRPPAIICPVMESPFCQWSAFYPRTPMWVCRGLADKLLNGRRVAAEKVEKVEKGQKSVGRAKGRAKRN